MYVLRCIHIYIYICICVTCVCVCTCSCPDTCVDSCDLNWDWQISFDGKRNDDLDCCLNKARTLKIAPVVVFTVYDMSVQTTAEQAFSLSSSRLTHFAGDRFGKTHRRSLFPFLTHRDPE
jgi:hypothetical protein